MGLSKGRAIGQYKNKEEKKTTVTLHLLNYFFGVSFLVLAILFSSAPIVIASPFPFTTPYTLRKYHLMTY